MDNLPEESTPVKPPTLKEQLVRQQVAQLDRLHEILDPYELLLAIERHQRDAHSTRIGAARYAMTLYPRFVAMTASWPRCDQDALVHAAKRIFRVIIPTMQADLKAVAPGVCS